MSEQADENKDTDAVLHGDGDGQPVQRGIVRSVRPSVPVPAIVLVCQMGHGALFLHGVHLVSSPMVTKVTAGM